MRVAVEEGLRGLVFAALGAVVEVDNERYPEGLARAVEEAAEEARRRFTLESLKDDPVVRLYRDFYWRVLGVDPTKQRPSQEALLRRILRGETPRVNPLVDAGNAASVKYLVPIGLYDVDSFKGRDLVFRRARQGEEFNPIGSPRKKLTPNQIVLSTLDGQILHVYPYRDSEETKVTPATRRVLVVAAGVPGVEEERLLEAVRLVEKLAADHLNGKIAAQPTILRDQALIPL
ncbi:B3/B4 domain-containing protein [Thermofilum pendens]